MRPRSDEEIRALVREAADTGRSVKVVGAGHSFTDIACTDGFLISLDDHADVLDVDTATGLVTVQAGIRLERLNEVLAEHGLAMSNLGDIAYQSVAGAISTATHGTGKRLGNLATFVERLTLIAGDASVVECGPEDPQLFDAARVSLGALGVISTVTLRCEAAFNLLAREQGARLDAVLDELDTHVEQNEHFEFFWFPHTSSVYMKRNNRTTDPPTPRSTWKDFRNDIVLSNWLFGAACRVGRARPAWIPGITRRVIAGGLGRMKKVDRSDRIFASPRLVRFSEMEYAIPREHARAALTQVRAMIDDQGLVTNFPVEVRFVAPDDITLSPAHGRETCYIAVHLYRGMDYEPYFRGVEAIMRSFDGRPHWGKLHFRTAADLKPAYPKWDEFIAVRDRLDPRGVFRNAYTDRVLGPPPG